MKSQAVIALDLGGTKLAAALFASAGRKLGKQTVSLESRTGRAVGDLIIGQVDRLRQAAARRGMNVAAVGVCVPGIANPKEDASVPLKNHQDKVGPVATMAFVTCVWMTVCTVAEILADRGLRLFIHPAHNVPGDTTSHQRLDAALAEYKRRIAGL